MFSGGFPWGLKDATPNWWERQQGSSNIYSRTDKDRETCRRKYSNGQKLRGGNQLQTFGPYTHTWLRTDIAFSDTRFLERPKAIMRINRHSWILRHHVFLNMTIKYETELHLRDSRWRMAGNTHNSQGMLKGTTTLQRPKETERKPTQEGRER